jgi:hypothetical protein
MLKKREPALGRAEPREEAAPQTPDAAVREATATGGREAAVHAAEGIGQGRSAWSPDPHELDTVCLGPDNSGPKMRLFRSNRFNQVQIRFDERPPEDVVGILKEDGWRWRGQGEGWTKQLDRAARWRGQADAERLFKEIADELRQSRGHAPLLEQTR